MLVLQLMFQLAPVQVIFLANGMDKGFQLRSGMSLYVLYELNGLQTSASLSARLFNRRGVQFHRVDYELQSFTSFKVRSVQDVAEHLQGLKGRRRRKAPDPIMGIVVDVLKRPKPSRLKHQRGSGKTSRRPDRGEQHPNKEGSSDECDEDSGEDTDVKESDGDKSELFEEINPVDVVDELEPSCNIVFDYSTYRYKLHDLEGAIFGRCKPIPGRSSTSMNCRLH